MTRRIVVVTALAIPLGYLFLGGSDAVFRSTDGQWADSEVLFKGRDFKSIVWNFESYKLRCAQPAAKLVRATPQYWYNPFLWYSYLSDLKWRVPYSDAHPEIGNYYPPAYDKDCYNEGSSPQEMKAADAAAARHLAQLK